MARSKGMGGGPSMAFEKPRAGAKAILRRLWRYLYHYKWLLAAAVALSLTGNLLALAGPKLSGYAIDAIRPGPGRVDFTTVFHYAKRMLVFYFAAAALSYVLATLMVRLSRNVVYRMRKDIYDHLMRLPVRFFDTHAIGDVLSVLSYDVDTINASLSNDLVQMLTSVITVAGSFGMMLSISPQLILIFVVTIPISVMFTRHRSKRVRPLYRRRSAGLGALNGFAEEMTGGLKTIKAYGREEVFLSRFEEKNRLACDANYEADAFSSSTGPGVNFINNLSLALVSLFGALLYMAGGISLGSVSSFVLYSRKFSGPINEFANIIAINSVESLTVEMNGKTAVFTIDRSGDDPAYFCDGVAMDAEAFKTAFQGMNIVPINGFADGKEEGAEAALTLTYAFAGEEEPYVVRYLDASINNYTVEKNGSAAVTVSKDDCAEMIALWTALVGE